MTYVFTLKGRPVSKKNTWAAARTKFGARIYQRDKTVKEYCQALRIQFAFQAKRQGFERIPRHEKVALRFVVWFHSKQGSMDVHNAIETVLDALQGVCYDDDNQVVGHFHPPRRFVDDLNPRVEVEVQRAVDAEQEERWR